jgi:hypothetical protein
LSEAEVIYLEPEDTLAAIRERLRTSAASRVLLVVPKECSALDSLVDLKLLARQAAALDKGVALVTGNRNLREQARSLGLRTYSSTAWAKRGKWASLPRGGHQDAMRPVTQRSLRKAIADPATSAGVSLGSVVILGVAFLAMLAFLGLMGAAFVPTAAVTLRPVVYPVSTTLTVQASPGLEEVDFVSLRVPARVVETEIVGDDELATTALRDEPEARASGEVVFTNRRSEATTVFSDTIVATSGGTTIRFRTTEEVTIPPGAGSRSRATVEAVEPGPSGNVPSYSINRVEGPLDRQVNVINVAPTEGGGMSQVRYVTGADKDQLRELSLHNLREQGYTALISQLEEQETLARESLVAVILSETYDRFPGEAAEYLNLHMRVLVRGTVIDRADIELLGLRMLQLEVREGFQLLPGETEVQIGEISDVQYDGTMVMDVIARGSSWAEIDELQIRESIRGMSAEGAQEYLARHLSLAAPPVVELSPDWWKRVPWLPFRIAVEVVSDESRGE